jgi:hypothetical protein
VIFSVVLELTSLDHNRVVLNADFCRVCDAYASTPQIRHQNFFNFSMLFFNSSFCVAVPRRSLDALFLTRILDFCVAVDSTCGTSTRSPALQQNPNRLLSTSRPCQYRWPSLERHFRYSRAMQSSTTAADNCHT